MRIVWDCRSVAAHMGGIAHAALGWLRAFLAKKPPDWSVICIYSAACDPQTLSIEIPEITAGQAEPCRVEAGFIAPRFEQLLLPTLLLNMEADLYFNPAFTLPAIKTTRFQATVIHDVVFLDHPEWVSPELQRVFSAATDLAMTHADCAFTVSEFTRTRLADVSIERHWPREKKVALLRPAVSQQHRDESKQLRPAMYSRSSRDNYILYLGSIEEKKGVSLLLDSYALLMAQPHSTIPRLVLAGGVGGQHYDIQHEIARRGLAPHADYIGAPSHAEKRKLMSRALLFVFPSHYEGFGIPPLEAMSLGTPVVATRCAALPEVLGEAAEFAEPNDAANLAMVIQGVLDNDSRWHVLAKAGPVQAERYRWEDAAQTLVKQFSSLVANEHSTPMQ